MNSLLKIIAEVVHTIALSMPNMVSMFHMYQLEEPKIISNRIKK